ncbi:MAG: ATP-binding protein [Prevotellaceae bacterium]|jgi:AAA+ ATPase superfamily predicted ATPase|nr:ATP-binding protein [Prevotellaceae bacterium]
MMMKFVDRIAEQARLQKALNGNSASFVVIYGRRRCGKSRLIKEILLPDDIYFMADQSEAVQQRSLLAKVAGNSLAGFDKVIYPDWGIFFETLNHRLNRKITLCLDEFPYMVKSAPELPSIIQRLMDDKANMNFNLVICGSSQQLMSGLVLDSTAPLFGRADEIMKIQPMQPLFLQQALDCSAIEAIEEYSIWGGIPRYWELRLAETNLHEALAYHLLTSQGVLYDEPMRLFLDDMRDTVHSFTILSLIASGCSRLSEIAGRLEKPATHLSAPLDKLLMLGYIEKEMPFNENYKNGKKSIYKIVDPFLHFYFRFVVPNRSFVEIGQTDSVLAQIEAQFAGYVAPLWEKLCRNAVPFLNINNVSFNPASRWWGKPVKNREIELDVVAVSRDEKYLLVGECKWSDRTMDVDKLFADLEQKANLLPFAQGKTIVPALFLKRKPAALQMENVFFPEDILQNMPNR